MKVYQFETRVGRKVKIEATKDGEIKIYVDGKEFGNTGDVYMMSEMIDELENRR